MTTKAWMLPAIAVVSSFALGGCAAKEPPAPQVDKHPWEVRVESPLDTIQVNPGPETTTAGTAESSGSAGAPIVETPVVTETASTMTPSATVVPAITPSAPAVNAAAPEAKAFTPGWRVQIFASAAMVNAESAAAKARQHFTEPVYVEYEAPLYKVRIGDFLTKEDARHMMNRAKAENYPSAWVVEDLVVRPEH